MVKISRKDCVKEEEEEVIRTSSMSSYSEENNNGMNSTTIDDDDDINNDNDNKEENKSLVSVLEDPCCDKNNTNEEKETKEASEESSFMKKTATAVAGGAIVGVGLVMIPLPGPGALIVGGGMALLGTEFPAVQRVLGDTCNSVADAIERRITSSSETITQEEKKSRQEEEESNILEKQQQQPNNNLEKKHVQNETNYDIFTNLGKKAIPVIRRFGEGVDKETLDAQTASILSTAEIPLEAASKGVCQLWRQIFVLDDDEDLMTPFQYKEKVDSIQ